MATNLWLIPALPLLGAIVNGLGALTGKLPRAAVHAVAVGVMALAFVLSVMAFMGLGHDGALTQSLYTWISSGSLQVEASLTVDPLSGVMILIITGIGTLIHLYSTGYMGHEPAYARFFAYLNLFVFFMLLLVMGSNMLMTFIGWEGVGLCSYLLIGFWYSETANAEAGKKAFVVNRVGDLGFLMGMFLLFWSLGADATLSYDKLAQVVPQSIAHGSALATAICLLLFVGATGKSAQIPLYVWLPDAMAGPTPVSALIHAATMVTAGIYMITRLSFLYVLAPAALLVIACIGAATALMAATIGLAQNDIKKVLAYSTVSQLGYMFLAVGVGAFHVAMFHLMTHAFFKACLFLGSGSVIHACHGNPDPQDMRQMGGLRKHMPITYWTFLISTLAIAGVIFTSGFFSKDEILAMALRSNPEYIPAGFNWVLWILGSAGALMTTFYMFRAVFMTFHGEFRGDHEVEHHLHESPWTMTLPLVVLAALALFGGWVNAPLFGIDTFHHFLAGVITEPTFTELDHGLEMGLIALLQVGIAGSIFLAYTFYVKQPGILPAKAASIGGGFIHKLLLNKYYIDELYEAVLVRPIQNFSQWFLFKVVDRLVIDGAVNGAGRLAQGAGGMLGRLQTGNLQIYVLFIVVGLAAITSYVFLG